ncbi:MAG: PAS domain-containing sensor histidine kinase [Chitinophagaceae bacterium]|nr:MAG: PAS domain-containing sensor histidine kinase [Chitinophagaceae bacterium]
MKNPSATALPPALHPDAGQLLAIMDRITDGFFAMDRDWRFVYGNHQVEAILGIRREDYLGRTYFECFPGMEDSVFIQQYKKAYATGEPVRFEAWFPPFSQWYSIDAHPSESGLSVFFRDITEQKRAEEQKTADGEFLRQQHGLLNDVLERMHEGFFLLDRSLHVHYWNSEMQRSTSVSATDIMGKPIFDRFDEAARAFYEPMYRQVLDSGEPLVREYLCPVTGPWTAMSIYPRLAGLSVFVKDIHERRAAAEELETLSLIARETAQAVAITDPGQHILWVNAAFSRLSGFSFEEALGKHAGELLRHPEGEPEQRAAIAARLARGESFQEVVLNCTKSGKPVWWRVQFQAQYNNEGKLVKYFTFGIDITERRKAEEKQHRYEEKIREQHESMLEVLEQMQDGFITLNREGRVLYWNRQAELLTGIGRQRALGYPIFELFPSLRATPFYEIFEELLHSDEPIHREVHSPISGRWEELHAYTTRKGISVFFRDISERKRSESAVRQLSLVAERTDNIVALTDHRQHITWVNDAFTRITGYTAAEAIGRHNAEIFDGPDTDPEMVRTAVEGFRLRRPFRIEALNYKKDGSTYWADITCQPVFDEAGELLYFFSLAVDITERKRLQQRLDQEQQQRQKMITSAAIKAQESERALVSQELHDNVNQVLTTVKLYTELCRDGIGNPGELMDKSIRLLQSSINEIRSLSKRLSAPSLGNIRMIESVRELIDAVGATNRTEIALDAAAIEQLEVDQEVHLAVYRILQEQLTNILKHADASQVHVSFGRHGQALQLSIRDNGKGFDPKQKGKGIGITNMTTRAESVHGTLSIESRPGEGCTLRVDVPLDL